jgi:hypothetical protein
MLPKSAICGSLHQVFPRIVKDMAGQTDCQTALISRRFFVNRQNGPDFPNIHEYLNLPVASESIEHEQSILGARGNHCEVIRESPLFRTGPTVINNVWAAPVEGTTFATCP